MIKYQSDIPIESPNEDYYRQYQREELIKQEEIKFKRRNIQPYNQIIKKLVWKK